MSVLYFAPAAFQNKAIVQGDAVSAQGWGKDLKDYHEQTGEYAYWSNRMFGGMPANYTYMPPAPNVFHAFGKVFTLDMNILNTGLLFLYLIGFYIFFAAIGCKPWLSIVGSIAFALCSYNLIIIEAGHINKGLVMGTMAPIIAGVILCYRKKYLWGSLITLMFVGLNVVWNHQQISYYLLLILLILALVYLVYAIKEHTLKDYLKATGILIGVAVLAILPAIGQLLPAMDYAKETMRGGAVLETSATGAKESSGLDIDYAYQWSYGMGETMTLMVPNMYGASSHYNIGNNSETYKALQNTGQADQVCKNAPTYWGPQPFTSGPVYVGAIICFLFLFGMLALRGKDRWWLLIATLLSFVLAWGRFFPSVNEFFFYHLPLYNKFRAPSMALVIASVTMVITAIMAIKEVMDNRDDEQKKKRYIRSLYIAGGITGGLCLIFALFGSSLFSFTGQNDAAYPAFLTDALKVDRAHMLSADAWRSFLFIALAFAALYFYLKSSKLKSNTFVILLGLFILIDLWQVDKRFLSWDDFTMPRKQAMEINPTDADKAILQDTDPDYRVLNLTTSTFNESSTSYFHNSVGGYSPAKLRRYQDIIDYYMSKQLNMNVLNMLNTRYVIVAGQGGQPVVQRNPSALGNAWFVSDVQWVNTPNEEIEALRNFRPDSTAYLSNEWKEKVSDAAALNHAPDSTASIALAQYKNPGNLLYKSHSAVPSLALFSEVYYKTWKAYIDGKEAPLLRANYILRALVIPAGNHDIEFKCVDDVIINSSKMSLYGSILAVAAMIALAGGLVYRSVKRRKQEGTQA